MTGEIIAVPNGYPDSDDVMHIDGCGKSSCSTCRIMKARKIAHAILVAAPTHWFSFTLVGNGAGVITRKMAHCFYFIRDEIPDIKYVWAAEQNPALNGVHLHGYLHRGEGGRVIKRKSVTAARRRMGLGSHWEMDELFSDVGVEYFGYPFKTLADPRQAMRFVELNSPGSNVQLVHHSKNGFWRDGAGGPVLTRRDTEVLGSRRASWSRRGADPDFARGPSFKS